MSHDNVLDGHILNIIQSKEILEQADLQENLKARGYDIPQATLSRRLKKLKIAKVSGVYEVVDLRPANLPLILNLQISDTGLIVLHTHPGNANSLAFFIDKKYVSFSPQLQNHSSILGTIAGDDTVVMIIPSKKALPHVLNLLKEDFPYLTLNEQ